MKEKRKLLMELFTSTLYLSAFTFGGGYVIVSLLKEENKEVIEFNGIMFDVPVNTVFAESCKDIHLHGFVIATEHSGEPVFKRYYGTVEDAVGRGDMVAVDYWIFRITPHDVRTSCRTVFPGHNHFFCHIVFSFLMYMCLMFNRD